MGAPARYAMILGFAVTLLIAGAHWLGWFDGWERRSIDWRFTTMPRKHEPMTSEIVHVDIDDNALKAVGRWPWNRSKVAAAVDELRRAGVKTIAFDSIFSEPEDPDYVPGTDELIDHDGILAEALSKVPNVLGVTIARRDLDDAWLEGNGPEEFDALMSVLRQNIQRDTEDVIDAAGLTAPRNGIFRNEHNMYRELAAWWALDRWLYDEGGDDLTLKAFVARIAPDVGAHLRTFPQRRMLEYVWDQQQSWRTLRRFMRPGGDPASPSALAPIHRLAESARSAGFVNQQDDPDGVKRSVEPTTDAHRAEAFQFGLAAAALHRGLDRREVVVEPPHLLVGDVVLPLRGGRLWLNWPTVPADARQGNRWLHVLRQSEDDPSGMGHVSIAVPVDLAQQRELQENNRATFADVTQRILAHIGMSVDRDEALDESNLAEARDEIEWTLEDGIDCDAVMNDPDAALPQLDESARDHIFHCCAWLMLEQEIASGEMALREEEVALRHIVEGKLAFIGWTATGAIADFVSSPLGTFTPGVVVHAVVADMAISGRAVHFPPEWIHLLLIVLVGIGCTLTAAGLTPFRSALVVTMLLGTYAFAIGYYLFAHHAQIFPLVAPLTSGVSSWVACTTLAATLYQRDRLRITRQFKARVSSQLVNYLVEHPDALSVSGQEREVTILFADLAGFTTITERMGGPKTVATINRYMNALTNELIDRDAYVNKFLGDGLMAFWSAFSPDPDQASQACRASLGCIDAVVRLNNDPDFENMPPLGLRVGVATGKVVVGDCGAPPALNDYTVIGNAVNLSSRLEGANKAFGSRILIDEATSESLKQEGDTAGFVTRSLGRIVVVGQSIPIAVYEVLPPDAPAEMLELSQEAIDAFARGDSAACRDAWERYEAKFGDFPMAKLHYEALIEADEGFNGVLVLKAK